MLQHAHTPYVNIAIVEKTEGLKGKVVVRSVTDLPFSLSPAALVHFTPPALRDVNEGTLESLSGDGPCYSMKISTVGDIGAAEKLVGRHVLVARADVDVAGTPSLLIGREVYDQMRGPIGTIDEVMITPANDVWIIDGPFGEVLLPVIDDVVLKIPDDPSSPVEVGLLPGLIADNAVPDDSKACGDRSEPMRSERGDEDA